MNLKKLIISSILVLLLCCSFMTPAIAAPYTLDSDTTESYSITRAEETKWYYRVNNGVMEKRLWSITNGEWLTDWEPVE